MATFHMPPFEPKGHTVEQRETELYAYIRNLIDRLNFTLSEIDYENLSKDMAEQMKSLGIGPATRF